MYLGTYGSEVVRCSNQKASSCKSGRRVHNLGNVTSGSFLSMLCSETMSTMLNLPSAPKLGNWTSMSRTLELEKFQTSQKGHLGRLTGYSLARLGL